MAPTTGRLTRGDDQGKRYCGLGNHYLQEPHKTIKEPHLLKFAKKLNNELRATTLICGNCLDVLQTVYATKLRNAIRHQRNRKALSSTRISDVSSTQSSSASSSSRKRSAEENASSSSDSEVPSASSAAAAKRKRRKQSSDGDDEDDSLLSLNAVNGTRLPQFQPIPKRRQVTRKPPEMDIYLAGTTGG